MKFLIALAAVVLVVQATSDEELWKKFKEEHGRQYRNVKEERERFAIFQLNLRTIEEHNQKYDNGEVSYYLGVTSLADMSEAEFRSMLATTGVTATENATKYERSGSTPTEVNWVEKGVVTGVKNQGSCGSCWAFAATGVMEAQFAIKHGELISLSEQDLMDCTSGYGNYACSGGYMHTSFEYAHDHGIDRESDYPYTGSQTTCVHDKFSSVLTVDSHTFIDGDENDLANAVANIGPVSVYIDANHFQLYSGGIFDNSECTSTTNHGVLIVGYGVENEIDYWLIKNSWGGSWGENGYFRMIRNKNLCGISCCGVYAIVN